MNSDLEVDIDYLTAEQAQFIIKVLILGGKVSESIVGNAIVLAEECFKREENTNE